MAELEQFFQELTEAHGVSGHEADIRALLRTYLAGLGNLSQDKLGSLICEQSGDGPRVMIAAHMDEIGFIVRHITKDGFIKFLPLGGWWDQVLLGHRVIIKGKKGDIVGVIGAKPPHLLPADERAKIVKKDQMYIDIGVSSQEEVADLGIRIGDVIVPKSEFEILGNGKTFLGKAFDDRVGCGVVVDLMRHYAKAAHPNHLFGVMTVMEEVGVRGATTSVRAVDPDVAIILEADIAGDVPGIKAEESSIKMGGGPSVLVYDARMMPNHGLRELVIETAEELEIPIQFSAMPGGATDGAAIHLHGTGVPTIVISVPSRHIHSHSSMIHREDYEQTVRLVTAVVGKLDQATVASLTN